MWSARDEKYGVLRRRTLQLPPVGLRIRMACWLYQMMIALWFDSFHLDWLSVRQNKHDISSSTPTAGMRLDLLSFKSWFLVTNRLSIDCVLSIVGS